MTRQKPGKRQNGAGGVREYRLSNGSKRWEIYFTEPDIAGKDKRRFKKGFGSERAALEGLQAIQVHIREGSHVRMAKDSFGEYAEGYLASLRVKPSTLAGYKRHYRVHIAPALSSKLLTQITKNDLNRLYLDMESTGRRDAVGYGRPSAPSTVRHVHALLRQILQSAVTDGLIRTNPATLANPPSAGQARPPEMTTWDAAQAHAFLEFAKKREDYLYLAWRILLGTGMRRGELVALRWRDVDLVQGRMSVQRSYHYIKQLGQPPLKGFGTPKSGRTRVIDIDSALRQELAELRVSAAGRATGRDDLILPNRFGEPLNPERLSEQFRERVRAAQSTHDLPNLKLHGLRHTHATLLLTSGIHPKVVQERLGHSSIVITLNTYSHVSPTLQKEAAAAIGDLLGDPGTH
jgi:integrase